MEGEDVQCIYLFSANRVAIMSRLPVGSWNFSASIELAVINIVSEEDPRTWPNRLRSEPRGSMPVASLLDET